MVDEYSTLMVVYVLRIYIYIYIIATFSWGVSMGVVQKKCIVSNNFDPFVFFPDGEGYMYVRPLLCQKPCPGRFTFGRVESPQEIRHPVPPSEPPFTPRTLWIGRGGGR